MTVITVPADRITASAAVPIFIIVAIDAMGMGMIMPLLPFYVLRYGASPLAVGLLISAFALCQFVGGPILGRLSDRHGRKPILIASQTGSMLGYVLLALAGNLPLIFLARIVDGLTAGNVSVAQAYMADNSSARTRRQAFGIVSAALGTGMVAGPALAGFLVGFGAAVPVWAAAGLSLASVIATALLLPKGKATSVSDPGPRPSIVSLLRNKETTVAFSLLGLLCFTFATFVSGLALYLSAKIHIDGRLFGPREVGAVFALFGVVNILSQLFLMKHLGRLGSDRTIAIAAFAITAVGYVGLGSVGSAAPAVAFLVLAMLGHVCLRPTLSAALSQTVGPRSQGALLGVSQSVQAASLVIAPLVTGSLIDHSLYAVWTATIGGLAFCGAVASWCAWSRPARHVAESDPVGA